jgi:hypothetical protein
MMDPLGIVLVLVVATPIIAILLESPIGQAFAARIGTRKPPKAEAAPVDYEELEEKVRLLEGQVDRLIEEGEFTHRLLMGKQKMEFEDEL